MARRGNRMPIPLGSTTSVSSSVLPLNKTAARIFRITHVDNLPWLLANGLHARSSELVDPNYRNIGSAELIAKRATRRVPCDPGGTLSDYVPFYFTSRSPMLLNIKTGRGVPAVPMDKIVIMASSVHRLVELAIPFVFTDRHAYLADASFFRTLAELDRIDWDILARSDFKRSEEDIDKKARYEAELLVHRHLPISAVTGLVCSTESLAALCTTCLATAGAELPVAVKPAYFF